MSSTRSRPFATLRSRIAGAYLALFALLLLVGFATLYGIYAARQIRQAEANLDFQFAEFSAEYLTGAEYTGPERAIGWDDVPPAIRAAIVRAHPDVRPVCCFSDGPSRYWIAGERAGEAFVFDLAAPDYRVEAVRLSPPDRVGHMAFQFSDEKHEVGERDSINLLLSPDGREILASTPVSRETAERLAAAGLALAPGARGTATVGRGHWRVGRESAFDGRIFVFAHLYDARSMRLILVTGVVCLALTLCLGSALGWLLSGVFVRGINALLAGADKVRAGDYTVRVPRVGSGREIDALVEGFNAMVAETETVVTDLRTISDNIAHDLRTPITRLRGRAELAFSSGDSAGLAEDVAEECASMLSMINAMLEIARTEAGSRTARREPIDAGQVAAESVELFSTLAEDRGLSLSLARPDREIPVAVQRDHLQRLFANLLDNALKFTPRGGRVAVSVASDGRTATLIVSDSGPGIEEKDLPHVFDRFYRSDRSRNVPGNGLGLALVKAIATLYNGRVGIRSAPGAGTAVSVTLPASRRS